MADPPPADSELPAGRGEGELARRGAPVSRTARWLEQQAGFVLIVAGAALIALATAFSDRPAVAPIFAVFGAGMIILGCFYSRIEGDVEASKDGVRTVVHEIERLAHKEGLPAESVPDLIEAAIDRYETEPRQRSAIQAGARDAARDVVSEGVARRMTIERYAVARAVDYFRGLGGTVTEVSTIRPYDLEVELDGAKIVVEVKATAQDHATVALTKNEVQALSEAYPNNALIIVSGTRVTGPPSNPVVEGGKLTVYRPWDPGQDTPAVASYRVGPPGGEDGLLAQRPTPA